MLENLKDILGAANPKNRIWPPTHNDPRIKGPQPRLVTREQYERLMKMREERGDDDIPSAVFRDK